MSASLKGALAGSLNMGSADFGLYRDSTPWRSFRKRYRWPIKSNSTPNRNHYLR